MTGSAPVFQTAICECMDMNASTMAVDITGRFAMISGRKSMALIDIEGKSDMNSSDPDLNVSQSETTIARSGPTYRRYLRNSKYEPTSSHFNRHVSDLYALSNYQVIEIFSINDINPMKPKSTLRGHSRAVADVEWSHHDPNLLGSSAADCLTNLWDVRDPRRPTASLTSVSGATLVRFCKTSPNLVATSHEIDVRVWDIRQPNLPINYIAAHLQKINGMDWCPTKNSCDQEQLITCSQDNTIKLWDLSTGKTRPSANLQTRTPAWRIRYTPVSPYAILTSTLPQLRSRTECLALKLWSMRSSRYEQKKLDLILGLIGHTDVIVDFDWRKKPQANDTACEIVSWSKDQTLRVWRIDNQFIEMNIDDSDFEADCEGQIHTGSNRTPIIGEEKDRHLSKSSDTPHLAYGLNLKDTQGSKKSRSPLQGSKLELLKKNEADGSNSDDHDESVTENTSSDNGLRQSTSLLKVTSRQSVRKKSSGLGGQQKSTEYKEDLITLSAQRDHSVPFPPTSGARFCGNLLVCFGRPMLPTINNTAKGGTNDSASYSVETPRSMAQLSAQLDNMRRQGSYNLSHISISYFYYGAMRRAELQSRTSSSSQRSSTQSSGLGRSMSRATSTIESNARYLTGRGRIGALSAQSMLAKNFKCGPVITYNVSNLLGGISKELAEDYVFDRDVIKMCKRNSEIAAAHNRRDLVQIWSLAELSSEGVLRSYAPHSMPKNQEGEEFSRLMSLINSNDSDFGDRPWTMHPFGSKLIQSLIDHYVYNCHDVQTAAMLVWTFSSPKLGRQMREGSQHQLKLTSSTGTSSSSQTIRSGKTYSEALSSKSNKFAAIISSSERTNTIGQTANDTILDEWSFINGPATHLYSNSWSNSTVTEDTVWSGNKTGNSSKLSPNNSGPQKDQALCNMIGIESFDQRCLPKLNILSPDKGLQNDLIMHIYAESLYRLNLLNQRAMVLKNIGSNSAYTEIFDGNQTSLEDIPENRLPNLTIHCSNVTCRSRCRSVQCKDCMNYSLYCSVCRLPVKGSCSICSKCLHGGHVNHFSAWFSAYDFCPTGCGCKCSKVM